MHEPVAFNDVTHSCPKMLNHTRRQSKTKQRQAAVTQHTHRTGKEGSKARTFFAARFGSSGTPVPLARLLLAAWPGAAYMRTHTYTSHITYHAASITLGFSYTLVQINRHVCPRAHKGRYGGVI